MYYSEKPENVRQTSVMFAGGCQITGAMNTKSSAFLILWNTCVFPVTGNISEERRHKWYGRDHVNNAGLFRQVIQHTLEENTRYPVVGGQGKVIDYPGYFHGVKMGITVQNR